MRQRVRDWVTRVRWWLFAGGDVDQQPEHTGMWLTISLGLLVTGGGIISSLVISASGTPTDETDSPWWLAAFSFGALLCALGAYFLLSLFLPLRRPRFRDQRVVRSRRQGLRKALIDQLSDSPPAPTNGNGTTKPPPPGSREARLADLIERGKTLRRRIVGTKAASSFGSLSVVVNRAFAARALNEWLAAVVQLVHGEAPQKYAAQVVSRLPYPKDYVDTIDKTLDVLRAIQRNWGYADKQPVH